MEHQTTDQEIIDYLLDDLDDSGQLRIEENIFTDTEFFDRLSAVENRLIDLYVLDKLSDSERKRFEEKYLINARRHKMVEASKRFISLVDSSDVPAPRLEQTTWWERFLASLRSRNIAVQFSLATLLLAILAGTVWLLAERARLKSRMEAAEATLRQKEEQMQRQAVISQQQNSEQRVNLERAQEDLKREQAQRESIEKILKELQDKAQSSQGSRLDDAKRSATPPSFATLILSPTIRSVNTPPKELIIRRGDKFVRLVVYLEGNSADRYRVSLQRVSGEEVWKTTVTKTQTTPAGERLTIILPSSLFTKKDYFVKVEGLATDGQPDISVEYALSVRNEKLYR